MRGRGTAALWTSTLSQLCLQPSFEKETQLKICTIRDREEKEENRKTQGMHMAVCIYARMVPRSKERDTRYAHGGGYVMTRTHGPKVGGVKIVKIVYDTRSKARGFNPAHLHDGWKPKRDVYLRLTRHCKSGCSCCGIFRIRDTGWCRICVIEEAKVVIGNGQNLHW